MGGSVQGDLDEHVTDQIAAVEETLARVDEVFGNLTSFEYHDIIKHMTSLEKAKYDLTNLYAINSLFWMYLRSFGEDPKNTSMKEELDRIRKQMIRVSQIANKSKMPRIDKEVAKRFVRHELSGNKLVQKKSLVSMNDEDWEEEPMETDANKSRKRKREETEPELAEEKEFTSSEEDESSEAENSEDDN